MIATEQTPAVFNPLIFYYLIADGDFRSLRQDVVAKFHPGLVNLIQEWKDLGHTAKNLSEAFTNHFINYHDHGVCLFLLCLSRLFLTFSYSTSLDHFGAVQLALIVIVQRQCSGWVFLVQKTLTILSGLLSVKGSIFRAPATLILDHSHTYLTSPL